MSNKTWFKAEYIYIHLIEGTVGTRLKRTVHEKSMKLYRKRKRFTASGQDET